MLQHGQELLAEPRRPSVVRCSDSLRCGWPEGELLSISKYLFADSLSERSALVHPPGARTSSWPATVLGKLHPHGLPSFCTESGNGWGS